MSAIMPWLRLYWNTLNYHKLQSIAAEAEEEVLLVFGAWVGLLCIAGRGDPGPDGGRLLITKGRPASVATLARELNLSEARTARLLDLFIDYGSIELEEDTWQVSNWAKYQRMSDNSAERVRRHRARKKREKEQAEQAQPAGPATPLPPADDDVLNLMNRFNELTGIAPPPTGAISQWTGDWYAPCKRLLGLAGGDLATASNQMASVLELMRAKQLKYTRPGSLVRVTERWLAEQAWSLVTNEIGRIGYAAQPELPAELVRAIGQAGGWQYVCTAPADNAERRFTEAYLRGL